MNRLLPFVLARRELRAGARGFRILIACLALGVGTIAAVQSLSRDILDGVDTEGRALLGGDVAVHTTYREATPEQIAAWPLTARCRPTPSCAAWRAPWTASSRPWSRSRRWTVSSR